MSTIVHPATRTCVSAPTEYHLTGRPPGRHPVATAGSDSWVIVVGWSVRRPPNVLRNVPTSFVALAALQMQLPLATQPAANLATYARLVTDSRVVREFRLDMADGDRHDLERDAIDTARAVYSLRPGETLYLETDGKVEGAIFTSRCNEIEVAQRRGRG